MRLITLLAVALWALGGCTAPQSSTQNDLRSDPDGVVNALSNTGQNVQVWPDGSSQVGSTQLDSGLITNDTVNWMGTSISGVLTITPQGVIVKNPGNLDADEVEMSFGEPVVLENGTVIVPIVEVRLKGLSNEVTTVVDASTAQVELWTGVLSQLSADQREQMLAALERDKVLTTETVGLIRAALEAAAPLVVPAP